MARPDWLSDMLFAVCVACLLTAGGCASLDPCPKARGATEHLVCYADLAWQACAPLIKP